VLINVLRLMSMLATMPQQQSTAPGWPKGPSRLAIDIPAAWVLAPEAAEDRKEGVRSSRHPNNGRLELVRASVQFWLPVGCRVHLSSGLLGH
jgi:hypothetical protein